MTLDRLQEFILLAKTLSFSETAKKMFITQSVLSRHIKDMEEELGYKLFVRNTRNVTLTEAGRQLALDAEQVLKKSAKAVNRLHIKGLGAKGEIKIACTESSIGRTFLNFVLVFHQKYPDVYLAVRVIKGVVTVKDLLANDVLFSPCSYPNIPEEVKMERVFHQPAFLAVSTSHRLNGNLFTGLEELAHETLFVPYDDELYGPYAQNKLMVEKCTSGKVNVFQVPNVATAVLMVSLGQGVAIVPKSQIQTEYRNIQLLEITMPECNFDVNMYFNTGKNNPAARLLYEVVLGGENKEEQE